MNLHNLHLFCPILFICGIFSHFSIHAILLITGATLILSNFWHKIFTQLMIFCLLGMIKGHFNQTVPEIYSYKRTSFSAEIIDIKQKEHGVYLELNNFKYIPIKNSIKNIAVKNDANNYILDDNPIFPKTGQMRIAKIGSENSDKNSDIIYNQTQIKKRKIVGLNQEELNKILPKLSPGNQIHVIGRFLLPTPNPISQVEHKKLANGLIDEINLIIPQSKNRVNTSLKTYLRTKFNNNLSATSSQFAKAIFLGDTFAINQKTRAKFQKAGTAHLLGVSVLNIAVLAAIFYYIIRWLLALFAFKIALHIPLNILGQIGAIMATFLYCYVVGFEYPLLRSLLMSSIAIFALYFGRNRNKEALLWSGACILFFKPDAIYDLGFQLSFGAVLGLCCAPENILLNKMNKLNLNLRIKKTLNFLAKSFYSTFFASSIIIPISLYQFHTTSVQPFIANMISIPFTTFIITPLGLLASITSIFNIKILNIEKYSMRLLDYAFIIFDKIASICAPIGINIHVDPFNKIYMLFFILSIICFACFKGIMRYISLILGLAVFLFGIITRPKPPILLVHPYAIGLILEDKIIAYPKCNFITDIWADAYNRKCVDGKNTKYFIREKCGKLIINGKIGLIFSELKTTCMIKTKNYIIPYSQQLIKTTEIQLNKNDIE